MNDPSLADLQIKVAFLEDALSKLSDEYYQQQQELGALKRQTEHILNKVNSLYEEREVAPTQVNEKPPHY